MTAKPNPKKSADSGDNLLVIAIVAVFAIGAFFLTRPDTGSQRLSPVSGLMTLRATVQESMPYQVAVANRKPTLIEFYADWCTTCQAMAPTLQAVHQELGDRVNFVMLDIDNPQWRDQVQQFRVTGVPHLALLAPDQTVADTFIGKVPKTAITRSLTQFLG